MRVACDDIVDPVKNVIAGTGIGDKEVEFFKHCKAPVAAVCRRFFQGGAQSVDGFILSLYVHLAVRHPVLRMKEVFGLC